MCTGGDLSGYFATGIKDSVENQTSTVLCKLTWGLSYKCCLKILWTMSNLWGKVNILLPQDREDVCGQLSQQCYNESTCYCAFVWSLSLLCTAWPHDIFWPIRHRNSGCTQRLGAYALGLALLAPSLPRALSSVLQPPCSCARESR